ncbi:M4 family metallopeptidase [Actinocrispum wychmicini]|uniref:Neutral metalloproteinase n=1 Tax=Actinocrispum wychmicini TaxID=1213861 RepID=A0A4R2JFX2_9PSEU|nr:M4 family metallopeptidase [Actinocrispum wychmicini]TCO55209.1 Zn-dependent metalloprotease [Actinocrispum wychmicini]
MKSLRSKRTGLAAFASLALVAALPAATAAANTAATPENLAAAAADRAAATGIGALATGSGETLHRVGFTPGGGGLFYAAYERTYSGLRVVGGDAVVVADGKGVVRDIVAATTAAIRIGTKAGIGPDQARLVAIHQMSTMDSVSTPELVVLAGRTPKLAYEVIVAGTKAAANNDTAPSNLHVFVDAGSGAVAQTRDDVMDGTGNGTYSGTVTIDTARQGARFALTDPTRPGVSCANQAGTIFSRANDVWGNRSGTNLETACVDAYYAEQQEWNMLRDWLGRSGINGQGRGFQARVGLDDVNAFWNGTFASFGHNASRSLQATSIDVVAHEFGHAIFQFTPGGAGTGNENGGLNESTGDIFGALTEAFANNPNDLPDFQVGEKVNLAGQGPIRFMYNPSLLRDPSCFSGQIPSAEVHAAAGPQNHWFYLLAQGSNVTPASPTCNGTTVTGIGIQKAGQIFYNGLLRKTSGWNYAAARQATVAAAAAMFGATECNATKAAWSAVNVPAQAGEAACQPAPANDFAVATDPARVSVRPGQSATVKVLTQVTGGKVQAVKLSASGLPAGATATFTPATVQSGDAATLTISAANATSNGATPVTVTGDGTDADRTAQLRLTVGTACTAAEWAPLTPYLPGNLTTRNGRLWESTWFSTGSEPGTPQSWSTWADQGAC